MRVMIVSDAPLFGEGLAQVLARDGRLAVACRATSSDAILRSRELELDAVLVDMAMSGALQILTELGENNRALKLISLGLVGEERDVIPCMEVGIAGYLCRDASLDELIETVARAVRGELRCSHRIAGAMSRRVAELSHQLGVKRAPPVLLTPREREIAGLLDLGLTNKEIAVRLGIEVGTVKNHVHHVIDKLEVRTRGEAAATARRLRLLAPPASHAAPSDRC